MLFRSLRQISIEAIRACLSKTESGEASAAATIDPDSPAYICFTSGSTGRPKGVAIANKSLATFAPDAAARFSIRPGARVALNTAPGFDVAVGELWMALSGGACLVATEARRSFVGGKLAEFLDAATITLLAVTPSVLRSVPPRPLRALGCIIAAGEACPPDLVATWGRGRAFFNAYGPTEATVYATVEIGRAHV